MVLSFFESIMSRHAVSRKPIRRIYVYPAYGVHQFCYSGIIDFNIIVYIYSHEIFYSTHRLFYTVKSGMSELVLSILAGKCDIIISRYGREQYLMSRRVDRHYHIDIASGCGSYISGSVKAADQNVERFFSNVHMLGLSAALLCYRDSIYDLSIFFYRRVALFHRVI